MVDNGREELAAHHAESFQRRRDGVARATVGQHEQTRVSKHYATVHARDGLDAVLFDTRRVPRHTTGTSARASQQGMTAVGYLGSLGVPMVDAAGNAGVDACAISPAKSWDPTARACGFSTLDPVSTSLLLAAAPALQCC